MSKKNDKDLEDENDLMFFKNYDYSDDDPSGPGAGLYHGKMDKYKSVSEFLEKSRKRKKAYDFILSKMNK